MLVFEGTDCGRQEVWKSKTSKSEDVKGENQVIYVILDIFFRWQKRVILNNKMSAKWSKLGVFTTWFLWDFGMEQTLGLDAV